VAHDYHDMSQRGLVFDGTDKFGVPYWHDAYGNRYAGRDRYGNPVPAPTLEDVAEGCVAIPVLGAAGVFGCAALLAIVMAASFVLFLVAGLIGALLRAMGS
jgi:hypothetical protein